jgi:hypothetical protein
MRASSRSPYQTDESVVAVQTDLFPSKKDALQDTFKTLRKTLGIYTTRAVADPPAVLVRRVDLRRLESTVEPSSEDAGTNGIEPNTHSFIVKIWLEETAKEAGLARWRGHITHVPSGDRRYLKDLDDVPAFMAPYLEKMNVHLGFRWKIRQWLHRF